MALLLLVAACVFPVCLSQTGLAGPGFSGVWHYVNVPAILCQGGAGFADIAIQKPPSGDYEPHVFTVFCTSNGAMTLSFVARDASGRTITDQSSGLNLRPVTPGTNYGRRLENNSLPLAEQFEKPAEPGSRFLSSVSASDPRRLSSRRRSFSSSSRRRTYTDSRRRTMSSPRRRVLTSPRRRTVLDTRRRTSIDDSRRRAAVLPSPRRRTYSSDGRRRSFSSYSNPSRPNMGQYGYANQHYAYQNYGGQMPMTTPYGYSGANAYQGSSGNGMKIAIAGGAGLLAGIAANKLMHHWGGYSQEQLMNAPCSRGSWQGTCGTCMNQYGANNCNAMLAPKFNAARDDLMSTGFTPAQVQWPLQVRVTHVAGPEFNPMLICTPPAPGMAHPPVPQVFLTLTALQSYSNSGGSPYGGYSQYGGYSPGYEQQTSRGGIIASVASSLLCCCCCCGLVAFFCVRKGKSSVGDSSSDDEGTELSHHAHHAHNPYWDTAPHAPPGPYGSAPGFMGTAAPNGQYWSQYCHGEPEISSGNFIVGPWGECLAWAVVYEHQNQWENDPDYRELGPVGGVIRAMMERAADDQAQAVQSAAEELEVYCKEAIRQDKPLPVINERA
ncbi:unnamed protein product [Cladocopium goreaui]|uniref:Phosphogluconate dehydrogenase (NADP(+)-dependent, decarboxylating) n=1 Tax=Cladocopium goreaui TaxID=2562237 RepID=A0A9P1FT63_9DINO|nr:unnamed protein product [Cladocopium goreaui]